MIDWTELVAEKNVAPREGQSRVYQNAWGYKPAVSMSPEFRRIANLPRRNVYLDGAQDSEDLIDFMTTRFGRVRPPGAGCRCAELQPDKNAEEGCITRLRLPQAQSLYEIGICGGALGPIGVGHGKTLIDLLGALSFRVYDANMNTFVLLVPASLVQQLVDDYRYYGQHFKMPQIVVHGTDYSNTCSKMDSYVPLERGAPVVHVTSYTRMSRPEATVWLQDVLKPDGIIADECFPADTLVCTDEGPLPIGTIVEQGRGSFALSYSRDEGYVWRPITRRLRRPGNKPLVRVVHEHGSFVCTEDHKIWTSGGYYVQAKALSTEHLLLRAPLSEMRGAVSNEASRREHSALLLQALRCERRAQGPEATEHSGGEASTADGVCCSVTGATRALDSSAPRADLLVSRRERPTNRTTTQTSTSAASREVAHGVRYTDEGRARIVPEPARLLQGGHRDTECETRDRGRRAFTQDEAMALPRPQEDGNPELSRVVRVEVLERAGASRYESGCANDPVYDLTVEGEHNYFADGVLVSNCHKLRNYKSAGGGRVFRYMEEIAPQTKFAGFSGSITSRTIKDYWHLSKWALRGGSPVPTNENDVDDWRRALDPGDNPADGGPLLSLCNPGEHLYDGFRRRVAETMGVVTTSAPSCDAELVLEERNPGPIPPLVKQYLSTLKGEKVRPDGEELLTSLEVSACAIQLACGFYYRWIYPRCEFPRDEELVMRWRLRRKEFFCAIRQKLKNPEEHMDSPRLLMNAAERHYGIRAKHKGLPTWECEELVPWYEVKNQVYAESEAVWFDDYLLNDALDWARDHNGIIWYEHATVGERLHYLAGERGSKLPVFGAGKEAKIALLGDAKRGIPGERGDRAVACSVRAISTGTNGLQHRFWETLLLNPMADPNGWEQLLGRTHRPGQPKPQVLNYFYRHTEDLRRHIDSALQAAYYVEGTGFGHQKILRAFNFSD